jgi:site-specific DNA-methyltransferase (adenine-specific)
MVVKTKDLQHHPQNSDIYDLSNIEDLVNSIREVGLLQPIIINKKNQILSGHRRFEAIKILGWDEVQVEVKDIKEKESDLYLVHFNKQRIKTNKEILSEYDVLDKHFDNRQGMRSDLTSVRSNKSYDKRGEISSQIGISSSQMGKLLFIRKYNPDHIKMIDKGVLTINQSYMQTQREVNEKDSRDRVNRINVKIRKWRFYQKSSHSMKELSDGEIQTIFTSPPYWNKRLYADGGGLGNEKTSEEFVVNLSKHLGDCWRVLNDKGSFFLNLGDTFLNGDLQNVPHQVVDKLKEKGWILRNTIIWKKLNPKPSSSKSNLTPSYEFIFHLVKGKDYLYNRTPTKLSSDSKISLPPRHRNSDGTYSKSISPYLPSSGKNMGDYWDEDIVKTAVANQKLGIEGEHIAPFPKQIITLPILQTSLVGDVVLDPFCGSGSVGRVCDVLERNFVGYDLSNYLS